MTKIYPIIQVALESPFRRLFDYKSNNTAIRPGTRLSVPFGNQKAIVGIAIKGVEQSSKPANALKPIHQPLEDTPALDSELLTLCQWCADYYNYPLGEVCHLALPTLARKPNPIPRKTHTLWTVTDTGKNIDIETLKRAKKQSEALTLLQSIEQADKGVMTSANISSNTLKALGNKQLIAKKVIDDSDAPTPLPEKLLNEPVLTLNAEQQAALESIKLDKFSTYLLDGVTGSGKTEVYLQLIDKVVRQNRQALVLVPEIGLTPQTVSRFQQRFNLPIATLHSGLSDRQRLETWQQAKNNQVKIVIGTRSSIFTPLPELGLIIVDEEHDLSYKQQEGVRYSARDLAIVRAHKRDIPLILGTATPAIETLYNSFSGRYQRLTLTQRASKQSLPIIECINTTETSLDPKTINAIEQTLQKQQQVLVFINRRGYAPTLICQDCGWISQCPNCDSPMTVHQTSSQGRQLHCHHCDTKSRIPTQCSQCNSRRLKPLGTGTQRSEEQLEQLFEQTPILRIDRDSMSNKGRLENALKQINRGEPCILVGTQMLAKGHHFAKLGLAVILGLDSAFFSSDFRGAERMGQLLTQVAGRTGREQQQGRVLIQTQFSEHPLLQQLLNEGYHAFAETLVKERELSAMPPYEHLTVIRCHAHHPELAQRFLAQTRQIAEKIAPAHNGLQYLGPFSASMEKRNNRYHFILQIKTVSRNERKHLLTLLCEQLENIRPPKGLHWLIDVDPQEF